jgi:hypothetical protein
MFIRNPAFGWMCDSEANLINNGSIGPSDADYAPQADGKSLEMPTQSNYMFEQTRQSRFLRKPGAEAESRADSAFSFGRSALSCERMNLRLLERGWMP